MKKREPTGFVALLSDSSGMLECRVKPPSQAVNDFLKEHDLWRPLSKDAGWIPAWMLYRMLLCRFVFEGPSDHDRYESLMKQAGMMRIHDGVRLTGDTPVEGWKLRTTGEGPD